MDELDEETIDEPTMTEEQAEEEATLMAGQWISIAAFSILMTLLIALALLIATGLIEIQIPLLGSPLDAWAVLLVGIIIIGVLYVILRTKFYSI